MSKKNLFELMVRHNVEYIDLPMNDSRIAYFDSLLEDKREYFKRDGCLRVLFDEEEQRQRASANCAVTATLEELKICFVNYLLAEKPELLECKVEHCLHERGHKVLWTPPYCPDLQPIEMFWSAGKQYAANRFSVGRTMKETIKHLRQGWYGTGEEYEDNSILKRGPVDCLKLVEHSIKKANTKFIPICDGILGLIRDLVINENHNEGEVIFPIDALVVDLMKGDTVVL